MSKFEHGTLHIIDPGSDKSQAVATTQCVHCGKHFEMKPGSGKMRGFCMRCNGYICGPECAECIPQEQMIENIEKGLPLNHKPIRTFIEKTW